MAFSDELDRLHSDCLDTTNGFGVAATLVIPPSGELDINTGVRAGTPQTQDITVEVQPTTRRGRAEQSRVWCRVEDVTLDDGVPKIGWRFSVLERTWTITSVERDAHDKGYWLTGEVSSK